MSSSARLRCVFFVRLLCPEDLLWEERALCDGVTADELLSIASDSDWNPEGTNAQASSTCLVLTFGSSSTLGGLRLETGERARVGATKAGSTPRKCVIAGSGATPSLIRTSEISGVCERGCVLWKRNGVEAVAGTGLVLSGGTGLVSSSWI